MLSCRHIGHTARSDFGLDEEHVSLTAGGQSIGLNEPHELSFRYAEYQMRCEVGKALVESRQPS